MTRTLVGALEPREPGLDQLLSLDRVDLVAEHVAAGEVAVDEGEPRDHHGEHGQGPRPDATRTACHPLGDLPPPAVRLVGALAPHPGMNGQKARRPNTASSAGRIVSIEIIAIAIPSAPIGPRPEVPVTSATTA